MRVDRERFVSLSLACALAAFAGGCDGGPELVPVTGAVTLDGAPLGDAIVEFQPKEGRPSFGLTGQDGRYELKYADDLPGASPGAYTVRIRRNGANDDGVSTARPLPAKYDSVTELRADVVAEGPLIDFALKSR